MKCALIPPVSLLRKVPQTDFSLVLPHLFQEETYRAYYREVSTWKIVDNGAAEAELTGLGTVIKIADALMAHEIVLPDVMGNAQTTINNAKRAGHRKDRAHGFMGVAQGMSVLECTDTIKAMHYMPWVSSIAIPRLVNTFEPNARLRLVEIAHRFGFDQIHCLGTSIRAGEARELARQGIARSIDTSLPINLGLLRIPITPDVYAARTAGYFKHPEPTEETGQLITDNCNRYLDWCNGQD